MKHLEIYENFDLDILLKDMQDLEMSPKLKGWWIKIDFNSISHQYIIWDLDIHSAMFSMLSDLRENIDLDGSEYIENEIKKFVDFEQFSDFVNGIFGIDLDSIITAWEMIPNSIDIREKKIKCIDSASRLSKNVLNSIGRKEFSNFDEILEKYPEGNA